MSCHITWNFKQEWFYFLSSKCTSKANQNLEMNTCRQLSNPKSKTKLQTWSNGTRASNRGDLVIEVATLKSQATFLNDAFKLWNAAPIEIKNGNKLAVAKKEIRKFVKTLPI